MTTQNLAKAIRITALAGVYCTAILMCYRQWFTDFLFGSIWILSPYWLLFLISKTKQIQENKAALWATFLMAVFVVAGSIPFTIEETLFSNSPKDGMIFFALPCLQLPCLIIGVFIGMVFILIRKLRSTQATVTPCLVLDVGQMRMSILNKEVNANRWACAQVCLNCGWKRTPCDKWTVGDILFPPKRCPKCTSALSIRQFQCSTCGKQFPTIRLPRNLRMAAWGGNICRNCHTEIDKWGNPIGGQHGDTPNPHSPSAQGAGGR